MQNKQDWYESIQPLHLDEDKLRTYRVQEHVMQQLPHSAEREEPMKQKSVLRRIRPLIFAAAVIGVGAVSLVTANAATNGALFSKVTMYIGGKEVDFDVQKISEDENGTTYEFVADDSNTDGEDNREVFQVIEGDNGVTVQLEGGDSEDAALEIEMADSAAETTESNAE